MLEGDRTDLHFRKFTRTATVVRMGSDRSDIKGKRECVPGWSQTEPGTQPGTEGALRGGGTTTKEKDAQSCPQEGWLGRAVLQQEMLS